MHFALKLTKPVGAVKRVQRCVMENKEAKSKNNKLLGDSIEEQIKAFHTALRIVCNRDDLYLSSDALTADVVSGVGLGKGEYKTQTLKLTIKVEFAEARLDPDGISETFLR